ncbi:hypothetical protein DPMN_075414 [Dreissena polymorpha]|uniref:Uncharacterized protein n=1 Tax=Dreissena polymorpha TaxID=45954 RepID=A0A9D3YLM1_DREPO|nr:hypothetical protein DPMN_075414 [Dreissena polymorpha]
MEGTPKRGRLFHLKQEECKSTENIPNGSIRHVDASFRCEDKISPMLAILRMTPGKRAKTRVPDKGVKGSLQGNYKLIVNKSPCCCC